MIFLAPASAFAQNAIYVFPPAPSTPVGGTQSIMAVVTGNPNKSVNWSTTCGTLIGSGSTIGLKSTSTGSCTVTATLAADHSTAASATVTFEPIRPDLQASSTHPRLGLTPADVTSLQMKIATSANQVYSAGLSAYFSSIQSYYNQNFCWTGANCGTVGPIGQLNDYGWIDASNSFSANGGGPFEEDMLVYGLMALIDPNTNNRPTWASHARDLAMWEMNEVCYNAYSGTGACVARKYTSDGLGTFTPFIGSQFILNNRAQTNTIPLLETIDWAYSALSAADKAVLRQVGHIWGKQLTGAYELDVTSGINEHVIPIGAYNSPSIINPNTYADEGASNNYSLGHWQAMTAIGMLLDPADDVAVSSCATSATTICSSDGTAQTVGAYAVYAVKGWLYRLYANFEDQHIVDTAYGLPDPFLCPDGYYTGTAPYNKTINCTGQMSGGFVGEGTGYGYLSTGEMFTATHMLYEAGKLNPATDPQASFISSAFWDKLAISEVAQLWPQTSSAGGAAYTPVANDPNFGVNNTDKGVLLNRMEVYDAAHSSWRTGLDKWYGYNNQPFGYQGFFGRFMGSYGNTGSVIGGTEFTINTLLATSANNDGDFSTAYGHAPTQNQYDPRNAATLPVEFENLSSPGGFYHFYGRTDWTTNATQFQFHCNTGWQDHASSQCGRIDFIRNNEALTMGMGGTSNSDLAAQAPINQNMVGYQWGNHTCDDAGVDVYICTQGGQVDSGYSVYSSVMLGSSSGSNYYYGVGDGTGAYNFNINGCVHCSEYANVNLAQREVFWLKPDIIWIYDRAETTSSTSFKNWYLDLPAVPTISGNLASVTTPGLGQKLFVTSVLPGTSSFSQSALDTSHFPSAPPVNILLTDIGPTSPSVRMLHTLEGTNAGGTASATALVQSASGTAFQGAAVGTTLVMFKSARADSFSSVTYPASGATTQYVTGLTPETSYFISGAGTPASATSDSGGVVTFAATGTGLITVSLNTSAAPSLQSISVAPSTATLQPNATQQFTATCQFSDSSSSNCTSSVTWSSTANSVATVTSTGLATGVAQGTAAIVATLSSVNGQASVTVPAAAVTLQSITVTPQSASVAVGNVVQYKATGTYSDSSTADVTSQVTWSSSNTSVATVDTTGFATAKSSGSTNIVATKGSVQGQTSLTVMGAAIAPAFSPAAGTYTSTQSVSLSTSTPSATIYYTTNGTAPTTSSTVYSGPITVSTSETIQAIAAANGYSNSTVSSAAYTINLPAAAPTFSPAAGTYTSVQTVSLSSSTPSATIYYTTNGSTPTTSSTAYSGPVTVSASETVKAIAIATGYSSSTVSSAAYTINLPAAAPTFSPAAGTYTSVQTVSLSSSTPSATIYYTTNGSTPTTSSTAYSGPITVSASETVKAIAIATGYSSSTVSSAAYTINLPAAAPTFSPAAGTYTSTQTVSLSSSTPSATIYYTTNGSTPTTSSSVYSGPITVSASETVKAIATASGYSSSTVSSAAYTINLPAAAPTFSPAAGTYTSIQTVSLSSSTPSATIYYTTNGATPTTSSTLYSGPITVSASETIKAIATASGYSASPVSSAAYTINLPAAAPVFSVAPGTYTSVQTVGISTTTPAATIYYTTNGSTPTTSSPVYAGPITVSSSETIQAIADATGYSASPVSSAAYTINLPAAAPTFSPAAGTYTSVQTVSISSSTPAATIYYTTNGATPTTSSSVYAGPINVSTSQTVKAIALASGYSSSPVSSAAYTINLPAAAPIFSVAPGTYTSVQTVGLSSSTPSATIYYTTNGATPTTSSNVYSGPITVSTSETVMAIAIASGYSSSTVSSAAYTINLPAAAPIFSVAPGTYTSVQTVAITSSTPAATIYYTTNGATPTTSSNVYSGPITVSASETVQAIAIASGYSSSPVSSAAYTINLPAAAPIFSVAPGTYTSVQTVGITSSTPAATIYYTTNGATPTTSSNVYSGPITVSTSENVMAIAIASGYSSSTVSSAAYTINLPAAAPIFSIAPGTYTSVQTVAISSSTPAATIYYTTNGATPTTSSPVYAGPITVSTSETVMAIAIASGYSSSPVSSAAYTINLPAAAPIFSVAPGTYTSVQTVAISSSTPAAAIYYTTNGATPTTNSSIYAGPITVSASETVQAIAIASGYSSSPVSSAAYTINLPATAPVFSPAAGTYTSAQTVAISSSTPAATIYYTTNGATPTTSSNVYSGPITVSASETVQAIAIASGYSSSPVSSAAYTINLPAAAPIFSVDSGTYTSVQTVAITSSTPAATIYYTTNGVTPTTNAHLYTGPIDVSISQTIQAIAIASGYSSSPISQATYTINLPATAPVFSVASGTYTSAQTVAISSSTPAATIYYTTNGATPTTSSSIYSGPIAVSASETIQAIAIASGYSASPVSSAAYTINLPAAAPAFSVAPGTYTSAQTVAISSSTPAATIYYTTNGATPTTSSPIYAGPITVSASETIQAIAIASGYSASPVSSAAYTINLPAAAPVFSPAAGTYTSTQTVSISSSTPTATIYYTTNGATPTTGSNVYSGPITVSNSETIQAIAIASGYSASPVSSASYTINLPAAAPIFSVAAGTYTSVQTVAITSSTPAATIYYTTNGATPTTNSSIYAGPITVSASETVQAIAIATGYSNSPVSSAAYTINLPAAAPIFSLSAGSYNLVEVVSLSTPTPGATIYYTMDGSTPTTASAIYSGPINIVTSLTLQAIAIAPGYSSSPVSSALYTITLPAAPPVFSLASGTYNSTQTVSVNAATPGATIFYTTDGTVPTTSSLVYTAPISIPTTQTLMAITMAKGYVASSPASASYTITSTPFDVTLPSSTIDVALGSSATMTVSVTPQPGFGSDIALSCSGLPVGITCSFSPATVKTSNGVASSVLTVSAPTLAASSSRFPASQALGTSMAFMLFCFSWKKRRGIRLLSIGLVALLGLSFCTGCGTGIPANNAVISVVATHGAMQSTPQLTLKIH